MTNREPRITPVAIGDLRPTQITVGMREVAEKRKIWRDKESEGGAAYLGKHLIPVLLGPKGRPYVIDHHHLSLALMQEGVKDVATTVVADLSMLDRDAFWVFADNRGWCHPYDAQGRRLRQGDHALQRVPVGGFPPPPAEGGGRAGGFRRGLEQGLEDGAVAQDSIPAGMVRSDGGRLSERGRYSARDTQPWLESLVGKRTRCGQISIMLCRNIGRRFPHGGIFSTSVSN